MNINYYQTIPELGIKGRINTPEEFAKIGLPEDLTGKSVLDIGCNIGAFLIEAHKRGANILSGIEPNIDWRLLAKGIAAELNIAIDYYPSYTDAFVDNASFDVVLLLSVLHVCKNPQQILDDAWEMTNGLLIVEINDRLQSTPITLPPGAKFYGKNKDNRSVWHHIVKNNG